MSNDGAFGFWSYTHRDNEIEDGRIRRLANLISNEFELQTGEPLRIFVDNEGIEWGDEWRRVIDGALSDTVFFIPVITPNFLRSEECRREFVEFVGRANSLGASEFILPILYADTAAILDPETTDEIAKIVSETQYADWRSLRLQNPSSAEHRAAVGRLAARLCEIVDRFEAAPPAAIGDLPEDDSPGPLDLIAEAEEVAPRWIEVLNEIAVEVQRIEPIVTRSTEQMAESDRRGGGARGRLVALREMAIDLTPPADRIAELGAEYARSALALDAGVRALFESFTGGPDSSEWDEVVSFADTIRELAEVTTNASVQLGELNEVIGQGRKISTVIRKPLTTLQRGTSSIRDANTVIQNWTRLADTYR